MAGRPAGSQNKDKPFRDALRLTIAEAEGNPRKLRKIAEALFDKAAEGDVAAIKEIGDRLDGKPAQESTVLGEVLHRYVARLPEKAPDSETWQKQNAPETSH